MKFDEILKKEPALIPLVNEARRIGKSKFSSINKNHLWYHDMKHRMMKCVGFGAKNKELTSTDIYDTTYQYLIKLIGI